MFIDVMDISVDMAVLAPVDDAFAIFQLEPPNCITRVIQKKAHPLNLWDIPVREALVQHPAAIGKNQHWLHLLPFKSYLMAGILPD